MPMETTGFTVGGSCRRASASSPGDKYIIAEREARQVIVQRGMEI